MKKSLGATNRGELATFETLKCVQQGLSVTEISKYRGINRSSVYKVLSLLIKKGKVAKIQRGAYSLTEEGIKGLHSLVGFRNKLRQHNIGIKINVLESPKNWELKRNEIRQMPYFNKTIKLKNNEQDMINFGKIIIRSTSKSLILKMPTIYSSNWEDAVIQLMQILEDTIPKLEHQFKVKLVKDYKSNMKIISQEYAQIQDALAKLYRSEGNRIYLTGDDGKIWLITDFSFSADELEYIHPDKATSDIDAIAPMLNDLRKNPTTFTEVRQETRDVLAVAKAHALNIIKHQKVLDDILIAFRKINKRLDEADL